MIYGLHIIDVFVIAAYIIIILWIGKRVASRVKDTDDFFLAGRKLGKFYQFFMNFGCSTNADQAVAVSREVYRQGIGGMWIQFLVLFLTPFYWFTTLFFRRVRLVTIGDYYTERFQSRFLGICYTVFILLLSFIGGGLAFIVTAKTMMALTPKTHDECTAEERRSISEFREYHRLQSRTHKEMTDKERIRFEELEEKNKRGELRSYASHTSMVHFCIGFAVVVAIYTMLGGIRAAAITDTIQGILILIFSLILLPIGLAKIGGFTGLHSSVPDYMFELFGSASLSDYAWYTILAMVLSNLVSIVAVATGMQTSGSARDEMSARFGMIGGMFFKRIIMISWALTGLLAIGLFAREIHDPDLIWGIMTRELLVPGGIGLMLVGILAASMSTLDASSVSYSALFINNLYKPFRPGRSDRHYLILGKLAIGFILAGGVAFALLVDNLLEMYKYIISIPAIFGASIWLGFLWRRLTRLAVIIQVFVCVVIYAVIPNLFPGLDCVRYNKAFLLETRTKTVILQSEALDEDVSAGRAERPGQRIAKRHVVKPTGIFFEKVARTDPSDPRSEKVGLGRFHAELWILSLIGIDLRDASKSWLVALRFFFDALMPFVLLIPVSLFSRPAPVRHLDRFYAKMHTPVQPSPELDQKALEASYVHVEKFENDKMFPNSNWEIMKPTRGDYIGFLGSWVLVGVVLFLLWFVVTIR